ncbi:MAG: GLUG motif-containing protein, partial [Pseudohongiella sp.]
NSGGLAGRFSGTIDSSYASVTVTGTSSVGGLVGSTLNQSTITNSYATGDVTGNSRVGGLIGLSDTGTVSNSYAIGSVNDGVAGAEIGGLVGAGGNEETITNSYWNTDTTGQDISAGGTGRTSEEMRQKALFAGFGFDSTWQIQEGVAFPVLRGNTQNPPPGETIVTPALPATSTPPVVNGETQGGVFTGNVSINPGGVLNGGQITGTVQNSGEIRGDVTLGADTVINGGNVSGNISGNPLQPAQINGARVTSGARLSNVVIGDDTVLDPDVQLGPNVRFASPDAIPPGIDLTNALPFRSWAGGDGRNVPDLSGNVLTPVDGFTPERTIDSFRVPEGFEQGQARQDSDTGELVVISGNVRATVLPGRVRQASPDQEEGVFISDDGDIVWITADGKEVTSQPVVANRSVFSNVLGELGLESQFGDSANLRLTNPATGGNNPGFLSVRPEVLSFPATAAQEEGLTFRPVPGLNGATVAVMVFRDEDGNLMQQDLVPVPSDWQSLKSNLTSIEGLSEVRIDTQGIISVSVDGQPVRGQMQYEVTQGGFDDDVPAEGSVMISAGDVNGDGTEDFRVVYADGSSQLMLIFSNSP